MKINCLNCGKRISVTEQDCICKYCGYYNRQAAGKPKSSRQKQGRNDEKPAEKMKEKSSEFIMSRQSKKVLLIIAITLALLVQLVGVFVFLVARNVQAKRAANGEVLESHVFSDSTGILLLDGGRTLELGDVEIVDWQYGGLPDGYQLIRLPFVLKQTDYNEDYYYYTYLNVAGNYIDNIQSYYQLTYFAPEDYVDALGQDAMLYMIPAEYTSGELCIYVENEEDQFETKYVVPLVWK